MSDDGMMSRAQGLAREAYIEGWKDGYAATLAAPPKPQRADEVGSVIEELQGLSFSSFGDKRTRDYATIRKACDLLARLRVPEAGAREDLALAFLKDALADCEAAAYAPAIRVLIKRRENEIAAGIDPRQPKGQSIADNMEATAAELNRIAHWLARLSFSFCAAYPTEEPPEGSEL